jgi:hypothetical protein
MKSLVSGRTKSASMRDESLSDTKKTRRVAQTIDHLTDADGVVHEFVDIVAPESYDVGAVEAP